MDSLLSRVPLGLNSLPSMNMPLFAHDQHVDRLLKMVWCQDQYMAQQAELLHRRRLTDDLAELATLKSQLVQLQRTFRRLAHGMLLVALRTGAEAHR